MKKAMKQSFLCDMIFQNLHWVYRMFMLFNCTTARKFHCHLEFSDLLKKLVSNYFRTGMFTSYTSEIWLPWSLPLLEVFHFCMRFSVLYVVVVVVHYCHLPSIILCVSVIIMFLDSPSLSFTPNSFLLYISPNTNICWSELSLPLWLSTQCSDP